MHHSPQDPGLMHFNKGKMCECLPTHTGRCSTSLPWPLKFYLLQTHLRALNSSSAGWIFLYILHTLWAYFHLRAFAHAIALPETSPLPTVLCMTGSFQSYRSQIKSFFSPRKVSFLATLSKRSSLETLLYPISLPQSLLLLLFSH